MRDKKNDLRWLDLLEAKYMNTKPRFSATKKLVKASIPSKKLPTSKDEARAHIQALKSDVFAKKYHGSVVKLHREVLRKLKNDSRTWKDELNALSTFFAEPTNIHHMVSAKLSKIISGAILRTKDQRENPPAWISGPARVSVVDKTSETHPSNFFITHCQLNKALNDYISRTWNSKAVQKITTEVDWSFRKIRGNLTLEEQKKHRATLGTSKQESEDEDDESADDEDDEDDDAVTRSSNDSDDDDIDQYAGLIGLDSEGEELELELENPLPKSKKLKITRPLERTESPELEPALKQYNLPSLATGYFSGGSDNEDVDNDSVVKAATTQRKNRRGQRARQKIWEQKFGEKAKHVQNERARVRSEAERKKAEYEERERKRWLKAQTAGRPDSKLADKRESADQAVHPSWEAKKLAEEKQKNAKFQGKKITFD